MPHTYLVLSYTLCIFPLGTRLVHNITPLAHILCKHTPCASYPSAHTVCISSHLLHTPAGDTLCISSHQQHWARPRTHLVLFPIATHPVHNITPPANTLCNRTICTYFSSAHLVHKITQSSYIFFCTHQVQDFLIKPHPFGLSKYISAFFSLIQFNFKLQTIHHFFPLRQLMSVYLQSATSPKRHSQHH